MSAAAARSSRLARLGGALLLTCALLAAAAGAPATQAAPTAKVEPRVFAALESGGETTFWVVMRERASLGAARGVPGWAPRGRFVRERLTSVADRSQSPVRVLLRRHGAEHRSFWIVNAIRVKGDRALLDELAARADIAQIVADRVYRVPEPEPGATEATIQAIEWNIDRIGAPLVWSTFGIRGEGIVVANIDTGVQFDHPALVRQYRGNAGGGAFDHNYNWHDPSQICGSPSTVPCDNNGHGTHTMGTMVGDDGDPGANQIGVAPRARWIAAKGCEANSCSLSALLSSGQWVLAPTDVNGQNPRADLRPHVVNNSWGGGPGDTFYQQTVDSWVAAGIFPAFSNGNSGPSCGTSGSPGDYVASYSAGAFDINNAIAGFSSRGPSAFAAERKPNLSAPGVSVRSSVPPSSYASFSGTSMASPHVAATVALMWSAAPTLAGDIAGTRALLDGTATDVSDLTCGGTTADNNVWGEGRLNALAAVDQSPRGPTGTLQGTVTDAASGAAIAGATVEAVGPTRRTVTTNAAGQYSLRLPVGTYDVSVRAFGYVTGTAGGIVVQQNLTTTQNFALARAPAQAVSGVVRDSAGAPIANATVTILGTPIAPATTDAAGVYHFASVPEGTYDARAEAGRCNAPQTQPLVVAGGPATLDFTLPDRADSFGYRCRIAAFAFVDANTVLPLTGDDASVPVSLPFAFRFYGQTHTTAHVSTNGFVNFTAPDATFSNSSIPTTAPPNGAVYGFWDDLFVDAAASVRTQLLGTSPTRRFVIEWRNVHFFGDSTRRVRFEVVLHENGDVLTQYADVAADGREQGNSATIGIENQAGTVAFQYSSNEPAVGDGLAVLYRSGPRDTGTVHGRVTDANDALAVAGATVRALQGGSEVARTTTGADGSYALDLRPGTYTIEASATNYGSESATVVLESAGHSVARDFVLRTARAEITPASLELTLRPPASESRALTLRNTGSATMTWSVAESPAVPWLAETPTSGTLATGALQAITVTASSAGLAPGVHQTNLVLTSNSARRPSLQVAVRLTVPAYDQAVNVGGAAFTDAQGVVWAADRVFDGNWGFTQAGSGTVSTTTPIAGTEDDRLYQDARLGRSEYRFERLPAGTYEVRLRFAEIQGRLRGQRVFDVFVEAEQRLSLTGHDIAAEVGTFAADEHTFVIQVRDRLQIRLESRTGEAILNAIRVTHRP